MLHFSLIKGCGKSSTGKDNGQFTYIAFSGAVASTAQNDSVRSADNIGTNGEYHVEQDISWNPCIWFNKTRDAASEATNLGYILTTACTNGYFLNSFTFKNALIAENEIKIGKNDNGSFKPYISVKDNVINFVSNQDGYHIKYPSNDEFITFHCNNGTTFSKPIICGGRVTATSFNVSSDMRLKKLISKASINALDIVNKINVYTFLYTSNNAPSLGMIAQHLQDIEFKNGFSLVDTDEKGYLSIKESKLIYVAWKAIQEQQKEIEALRSELDNYKNLEARLLKLEQQLNK